MASSRSLGVFLLLAVTSFLHGSSSLRVHSVSQAAQARARTEIVELQRGVKYATNRGPYRFSHVPSHYQGAVYLRGDNDKSTARTTFYVDQPVRVFAAIDSRRRVDQLGFPVGWKEAPDSLTFTHNGNDAIPFHIYYKDYDAGKVSFNFRRVVMAGTFIMQRKQLPGPKLTNVVQAAEAGAGTVVARLQAGSFYKYATNRARYFFRVVPRQYENAVYLRGDNDKLTAQTTSFFTDVPVIVYVAIDTRSGVHRTARPHGFRSTGRSLIFTHNGRDSVPFAVFSRSFPAGKVQFSFTRGRKAVMAGVFVMGNEKAKKPKTPKKNLGSGGLFEKKFSLIDVLKICRRRPI